MVNHNGNLTINEAVKVTGKSISSLYRLIKSGKLQSKKVIINGKELLTIKNEELVRVFNIPDNHSFSPDNHTVKSDNHSFSQVEITEKLEAVMERFFERKQAELVKPMEQQLLYQAGVMAKENQFLKEKVETLLLENRELQDQLKALPDLQADLQQEKEKAIGELQELHRLEVERLKAEGEQREQMIAERWKAELETLKRPWWKLW